MPIYEFKCDPCNLKFEKFFSKVSDQGTESCPSCGKDAKKMISRTNFKIEAGSWISKDAEKFIGKEAEKRWEKYEERKKEKEKIREESGTHALVKTPDGHYAPLQVNVNGQKSSTQDALQARKELFEEAKTILTDKETRPVQIEE